MLTREPSFLCLWTLILNFQRSQIHSRFRSQIFVFLCVRTLEARILIFKGANLLKIEEPDFHVEIWNREPFLSVWKLGVGFKIFKGAKFLKNRGTVLKFETGCLFLFVSENWEPDFKFSREQDSLKIEEPKKILQFIVKMTSLMFLFSKKKEQPKFLIRNIWSRLFFFSTKLVGA